MNDFEKVDLINELSEIIQTKDKKLKKKSQIMKKLTMEILGVYKTKSSVKKTMTIYLWKFYFLPI